jgi:hypothetical protein
MNMITMHCGVPIVSVRLHKVWLLSALGQQLLLDKGAMEAYGVWVRRHGVKGTCAFMELEYFDVCVDVLLDFMHCGKNNGNQLMKMLAGHDIGRKHVEAIAEVGVHKKMKNVSVFNACVFLDSSI